ncbi:hypothetical protein J21TS7_49440 [Paenibacillus cineris]|uniref:Uncharacterized protein n=1 Tax=Paenibacillus cineris TaxID=237530 RepID=A0ABQ4LJC6_9BACL|nr:hypothetical protein J21TS7_49440 [Paenibacillus cineris]
MNSPEINQRLAFAQAALCLVRRTWLDSETTSPEVDWRNPDVGEWDGPLPPTLNREGIGSFRAALAAVNEPQTDQRLAFG